MTELRLEKYKDSFDNQNPSVRQASLTYNQYAVRSRDNFLVGLSFWLNGEASSSAQMLGAQSEPSSQPTASWVSGLQRHESRQKDGSIQSHLTMWNIETFQNWEIMQPSTISQHYPDGDKMVLKLSALFVVPFFSSIFNQIRVMERCKETFSSIFSS